MYAYFAYTITSACGQAFFALGSRAILRQVDLMRDTLRALRLSCQLTQADFAALVHRDQHWASRMERGQRLTLEDLTLWAQAAGVEFVGLFVSARTARLVRAIAASSEEDRTFLDSVYPELQRISPESRAAFLTLLQSLR